MNRNSGIVVDVGTPSSEFQEWSSAQVRFHRFANLPYSLGQYVDSPIFTCSGKQWHLRLYPRSVVAGKVSIFLGNCVGSEIADLRFNINNSSGIQASGIRRYSDTNGNSGWLGNVSRKTVMESLVGGALVIEVFMRFNSKAQPPL